MSTRAKQIVATSILIACGAPAHAYLDPGTGSMLIQGLIAAIAAAGVTLKLYWQRITAWFSPQKNRAPEAGESDSGDQ